MGLVKSQERCTAFFIFWKGENKFCSNPFSTYYIYVFIMLIPMVVIFKVNSGHLYILHSDCCWATDLNGVAAVTCTGVWLWDKMSQSRLICIVVHLEVRASCVLNIEIHVRRTFTAIQHGFHGKRLLFHVYYVSQYTKEVQQHEFCRSERYCRISAR